MLFPRVLARGPTRPMPCEGAHDTVNDWQTTTDVPKRPRGCPRHRSRQDRYKRRAAIKLARQPHRHSRAHLIRQPTALLLLPALCNSLLLVASSSRQVSDVMVVPSGSTRTLIE